jgi:hypothetical protein
LKNAPLEEKDFDLRHLGGQELSEEDKSELKEFIISCGYQPGSILFGGVDEEILGCIRNRAGAKIVVPYPRALDSRSWRLTSAAIGGNILSVVCFIPILR